MLKSRDITLPTKISIVKAMVFPVVMNGCETLNHKEGWALKNWCFWTVVLEKTLGSPLNSKDIKPVNPERNQLWIFIEYSAEAPILWLPDAKSRLTGKDPDAQKKKGAAEDEWLDSITHSRDMNLSKLWEIMEDRGTWLLSAGFLPCSLQIPVNSKLNKAFWEEPEQSIISFPLFTQVSRTCLEIHF